MSTGPLYAYFDGSIVPFEDAKVSVMTHALSYGTGVFEGIRGYWNEEKETLFITKLREHYVRFHQNTKMMSIHLPLSVDELCDMTVRMLEMNNFREDAYIRPLAYKSSLQIGVSMEGVADGLTIFAAPFGAYVDIDRGLSVCVSSWRRTSDNAIPPRAKVTGNYANTALIKNEAVVNGYDEAVVLTEAGHVAEGSAENIFLVRGGQLVTPSVSENILEGITRLILSDLAAKHLGLTTVHRTVARSELYIADEIFLCGTGAQLAPVTSVDRHPVADGEVGPVTKRLRSLYLDAVHGRTQEYLHWLTPVRAKARVAA